VGTQNDGIGEAERHDDLIGRVPLKLLLQAVGLVTLVRKAAGEKDGDDGAPGLPRQCDRPHATSAQ
jgi:hypothetical protein